MKINEAIKSRWSPKAFSSQPVTEEMLCLLFEAARRAPSSRNEQPWVYYYVHHSDKTIFDKVVGLLTGTNPDWACEAQALIISVMKKQFDYKNRPNGKALHDVGAANVLLAVQAAEMGLQVHPMGGFDKEKTAEFLQLDTEKYEPVIIIAVGFPDTERVETEELKQRRLQSQTRKELKDFVFSLKNL